MLLHLVRQHALQRLAFEVFGNLAEGLGDLGVSVTHLDQPQRCFSCVPRGHDDIRPFVLHRLAADDDGVRSRRDEAVQVASHVDLGDVAGLQGAGLAFQRGIVAAQLVHGNACGERNALLDLLAILPLLVVQLAGLLLQNLVALLANRGDVCIWNAGCHDLLQRLLDDVGGRTILGRHIRIAQVGDLLGFGLVVAHCVGGGAVTSPRVGRMLLP
mmetsp:Transcript_110718/g.217049  ORF Transcript_110718/g.217049 Transcript_110718/m.217049 type:complete len:214 (+) Transcript_110718:667-1308(+)